MFLSIVVSMLDVLDDVGGVSSVEWFVRPRMVNEEVLFVEKWGYFFKRGDGGASN